MIVVHTALLREFRLLPGAVRRTDARDRKQIVAVASHLDLVCQLLHHHHEGEDALLWPKLRIRTPTLTVSLIDDAEAQHHGLDEVLAGVQQLRAAWHERVEATVGDQLAAQLEKLHTLLSEHLELEERRLLPLAAAVLSEGEWKAIGEAAVATLPKKVLPLVFGMFAYEGDPVVLRAMLAAAPPVPRALLPIIAPRVYARRARRVYGTARP